jgi:hypothetical protein
VYSLLVQENNSEAKPEMLRMSECLKGIYKQKKFAMLRVIELDMPLLQVKPVCEKKITGKSYSRPQNRS